MVAVVLVLVLRAVVLVLVLVAVVLVLVLRAVVLVLKVVSESRLTWATSMPILIFLSVLGVRPSVCDRQIDVRQKHRLMPPPYGVEA